MRVLNQGHPVSWEKNNILVIWGPTLATQSHLVRTGVNPQTLRLGRYGFQNTYSPGMAGGFWMSRAIFLDCVCVWCFFFRIRSW